MRSTPEVPDAVECIAALVDRFGGRVWLVSKCGPKTRARTLRWLDQHEFYVRTAVAREYVRFCRERADKALHCAELELTHFVDDRPDVHTAIHGLVEHQYLFGPRRSAAPPYVTAVLEWPETRRLTEATLANEGEGAIR
jgi:hypothetical protein